MATEGIKIEVENNGGVSVIHVSGFVDTTTSPELEKALGQVLKEKQTKVVIDLAAVDYISSAGWGIFISEIKDIRERGGDLKLARMSSDVGEVFELLEFGSILQAHPSVEEAVKAFSAKK